MPIEQGSAEWFAIRCGKVTASRMADMTAKTKTGYAASRANYMAEIICERLTGRKSEGYTSASMQWGTDTEPQARLAYQFLTDNIVTEVGFVEHPAIKMSGASPDGLINDDGMLEIKCPNTSTHIETLLGAPISGGHIKQMQWQMACTGRDWNDYESFDPRLPAELQTKIIRTMRDNEMIGFLEAETISFLREVDEKIEALRNL